jgi:peptide methionine sulfoxide reductase MsrA
MTPVLLSVAAFLCVGLSLAFHPTIHQSTTRRDLHLSAESRRSFFVGSTAAVLSGLWSPVLPAVAAQQDEELVEVYFGQGCFWHVQHELAEAERKILGRSGSELTARAGYAGGRDGAQNGKVCYHNAANVAYYGKLGHAEVVSLKIPPSKFKEFAKEYAKLFEKGMRPDQLGDRGLEYRNLVGLKGGANSPLVKDLIEASKEMGDELDFAMGKGSDGDVPRLVWIMDTDKYPFYIGEAYHQFHDGFKIGENYPGSYNNLIQKFANEDFGGCPTGQLGLGVGGL